MFAKNLFILTLALAISQNVLAQAYGGVIDQENLTTPQVIPNKGPANDFLVKWDISSFYKFVRPEYEELQLLQSGPVPVTSSLEVYFDNYQLFTDPEYKIYPTGAPRFLAVREPNEAVFTILEVPNNNLPTHTYPYYKKFPQLGVSDDGQLLAVFTARKKGYDLLLAFTRERTIIVWARNKSVQKSTWYLIAAIDSTAFADGIDQVEISANDKGEISFYEIPTRKEYYPTAPFNTILSLNNAKGSLWGQKQMPAAEYLKYLAERKAHYGNGPKKF